MSHHKNDPSRQKHPLRQQMQNAANMLLSRTIDMVGIDGRDNMLLGIKQRMQKELPNITSRLGRPPTVAEFVGDAATNQELLAIFARINITVDDFNKIAEELLNENL